MERLGIWLNKGKPEDWLWIWLNEWKMDDYEYDGMDECLIFYVEQRELT